ncbi:MAG TPA: hypothetical protein VGP72_16920 [Planctomycetota bacterium]|jgi:hypothetical protein
MHAHISGGVAQKAIVVLLLVAIGCGLLRGRVGAATPVAAAPSYISCTVKAASNSKFFLTDTTKQVICVYSLQGDQVRLVSARAFDHDRRLVDASVPTGMTREQAAQHVKSSQPALDALEKKHGVKILRGE